jgi:hypothetical protein
VRREREEEREKERSEGNEGNNGGNNNTWFAPASTSYLTDRPTNWKVQGSVR